MNSLNHLRSPVVRSRNGWLLALPMLAGLLAVVTTLRADNPPAYIFQWGSLGSGNGQFGYVSGVAVDGSNNVYVADSGNDRVEKFDSNGNYLTQWGGSGSGNGQFGYPVGIAIDGSNNVYVVDQANYRVEKFDSNGNYLTQWGSSGTGNGQFVGFPVGIAIDGSNNVYVADTYNNRIQKFDSNGNYLAQWGSYGTGNSQFEHPVGIAVDGSNNVYVVDLDNYRVEKFDSNGNYLIQWGSYGSGNGQFGYPVGIAVDGSNNVYVVDMDNHRVEKFDSNGSYLTQWGSYGSGNGQFNIPSFIAINGGGNFIYVTDNYDPRVEVFANNTNLIPPYITSQPFNQSVLAGSNVTFSVNVVGAAPLAFQWTSNNVALPNATNSALTLAGISISATYAVVVTNSFGSTLSSNAALTVVPAYVTTLPASGISANGAVLNGTATVAEYSAVWFDWGTDTNYGNIAGITVVPGGSNNLSAALSGLGAGAYHYRLAAANNSGIADGGDQEFAVGPDALPPTYWFQWGSYGSGNGQFDEPSGVTIDSSNNVYVTDVYYSTVQKFDRGGNYLSQLGSYGSGNGQFFEPDGIAVDRSNNVYVVDDGNSRIQKFDRNGNYLTQWGSYGSSNGQFEYPVGIAVDGSNNVYVADSGNDRVQRFDSNGNYLGQWGSSGSGSGQFAQPYGVAIDSSNDVYVTDIDNNRIEKFDSNGNYLAQWGSYGTGNGQFAQPYGVAIDSSNNIYVTDAGNNRLQKFDNNGNYLTQWGSYGADNGQFNYPAGVALDGSGNFIYVCDVGNSRIQVFVNNTTIPPIITGQPLGQTIPPGVNVSFNVTAVGAASLAYRWTSNNVPLPNATNSTLMLSNVTISATYAVVVTNVYGSTFSRNAVLIVVPALVSTLPASSITATGAVLNGVATVGSSDVVVWFDWGTDTNYGNFAGVTLIPGSSGNANLSTSLVLTGNVYHYRLTAASDYGIIYGNDWSFRVGYAPRIVTNTSAVNLADGVTLSATVNPEGWDTTVYFKWNRSGIPFTNSTPGIDIGAGGNPVDVSSFITGLAPADNYTFGMVASNQLGTVVGAPINHWSPPMTSAPQADWQSVAASADGSRLVAAANNSIYRGIYISTDYGATWTRTTNGLFTGPYYEAVASSADGTKLAVATATTSGSIFSSTNSGATWTRATNEPPANWNAIASSADGTQLAAVAENVAGIYTSTNSGANWTRQTNGLASPGFVYIASSADGTKLIAAAGVSGNGPLYTSTDSGATWLQPTNAPLAHWYSVASSADGNQLLACAYPGYVYLSTNAGANWAVTGLQSNSWNSVAESADGTRLVALANNNSGAYGIGKGGIWTSTNSGTTWVSNAIPSAAWTCAALSADGNEVIAVIGNPSTTGGILISQTTPAPVLSLAKLNGQYTLSWIIPSLDFTLQQSPDLSSWSDVTNVPALNLTNLENQVVLPPLTGNLFFRLNQQ